MLSYSNTKTKNQNKSSNSRLLFFRNLLVYLLLGRRKKEVAGVRGEGVLGEQSPWAPSCPLGSCDVWDKSWGGDAFGFQQGNAVGLSVPSFVGKYTLHKRVYMSMCIHIH